MVTATDRPSATASKDIQELTKTIRETAEKRDANLQRMAQGSGKAAAQAKVMIENDQKLLVMQGRLTGRSAENVNEIKVLNSAIGDQQAIMEAQKAELEKLGLEASQTASYRREELKLAKMELARAKASGSKEAEADAKKKIADARSNTFLGKIANGITDLRDKAKEKVKSVAKGGLAAFAFGAFAVAALAFLNSPFFDKTVDYITKTLLPKLKTFYDAFFGPKGGFVEGFKTLFGDVGGLGGVVLGLGAVTGLLAANKIAKFFGPLKAGVGKLLSGIGGLAKRIPGLPGGGKGLAATPGGAVSKAAGGIGAKIKAAGKGLGGFISGLLKGIASGLAAFANPAALVGLAAMAAAFLAVSAAIRIMSPAFEPIGKLFESLGKTVKSVFEGLGTFIKDIGESIKKVITGIADGVGNVIDKITKMQTAGTEATTKQIKELSGIPADALHAAAKGIDAMKAALDGFGGGAFSKAVGSLFGGSGPIDKIIELSGKVPELMKAAESISILGAAGSNYAMAEAEIERRKKVAQLQKSIAGGRLRGKRAEGAQAELSALQGQAMAMPAGGVGGNLTKIEGLVSEIVQIQRATAAAAGVSVVDASQTSIATSGGSTYVAAKKLATGDPVAGQVTSSR